MTTLSKVVDRRLNALLVLFPCLSILFETVVNQPGLDRLFRFSSVLNAVVYLLTLTLLWRFAGRRTAVLGLMGIVLAQGLRFFFENSWPVHVAQCVLFFLVGGILSHVALRSLRHQFVWIASLSVVLMLVQILGLAEWPYWWSTHGLGNAVDVRDVGFFPTLFVPAGELQGSFLQGRPSGIFYSNSIASLTAIFIFGSLFVFSEIKRSRYEVVVFIVFCVLTLSKTALFGLIALPLLAIGLKRVHWKQGLFEYVFPAVGVFALYAILFPGIVATYLNPEVFFVSLLTRVFDVLPHFGIYADDPIYVEAKEVGSKVANPVVMHEISQLYQRTSGLAQIASRPFSSLTVVSLFAFLGFRGHKNGVFDQKAMIVGLATVFLVICYLAVLEMRYFWMFVGILFPQLAIMAIELIERKPFLKPSF